MLKTVIQAIAIIALPAVVFFAAAGVMTKASNLQHVEQVVGEEAVVEDRKPLHFRLGYSTAQVGRYWDAIASDDMAIAAERRFLQLDLIFPLVYGAGLVAALLMAWLLLGRPFRRAWLAAPVAITLLADWSENLVQLAQLRRYLQGGEAALQDGWIQLASGATVLKLLSFASASLFLAVLVVVMLVRASKPPDKTG